MKPLQESIDRIMKSHTQTDTSSFLTTATTTKSRVKHGEKAGSSHRAARGAAIANPTNMGDKMGKGGSKVVEDLPPKVAGGSKAIASGGSAAPAKIGPPKTVPRGGTVSTAKAAVGAAQHEPKQVGSQEDSTGKNIVKGHAGPKVADETQGQSSARPKPKPKPKPKAALLTPAAPIRKGDEEGE